MSYRHQRRIEQTLAVGWAIAGFGIIAAFTTITTFPDRSPLGQTLTAGFIGLVTLLGIGACVLALKSYATSQEDSV